MLTVEDKTLQNQRNLRKLVMSVRASYGRLNLLIAICDNWKYRDRIISSYETELQGEGIVCDRIQIDRHQTSLKQGLQDLVEQKPEINSATALVTISGVDQLLGIRLNDPKSAQERFFFSAQWTREALREFKFPIVIWLTPEIATSLAQQAPDFWSWRGGVFEFSQPLTFTAPDPNPDRDLIERAIIAPPAKTATDPADLQAQIDQLQAQDPDSPLLASLYNSLGNAYKDSIRYNEAEAAYRKALDLRELGADHPSGEIELATSLNNLAGLYRSQGKYSEAEPLYLRSLEIWERQLEANHPSVATSLNNLAGLYRSQGKYSEAEPLYLRSLEIWERQLGADHPSVATSLNNLAGLYDSQGKYSEAEPLYLRSLEIDKRIYGEDHPEIATDLNNLAALYDSQGKYSEAEPLYLRSLEIRERQLGADHPQVASSLNNLAELYRSQGKYSEAEPLYLRSLEIRERQLGADHPQVASSLNNLAGLYRSQGKYSAAEPLYLRAIQILEQVLGSEHPNTVTGKGNYALLRRAMSGESA
jgi:tetratricopeptide (TPR) repeat protein